MEESDISGFRKDCETQVGLREGKGFLTRRGKDHFSDLTTLPLPQNK